jgi:DNA-directed RNA polymerase subunit RPC12/RpoP
MRINVAGGTHAGWRVVKLQSNNTYWVCPECEARNKYYWLKCPSCGHRRPEEAS